MGPNRLKLVEYLLNMGAKVNSKTDNGTSNLISACSSEDSDPRIVKLGLGGFQFFLVAFKLVGIF